MGGGGKMGRMGPAIEDFAGITEFGLLGCFQESVENRPTRSFSLHRIIKTRRSELESEFIQEKLPTGEIVGLFEDLTNASRPKPKQWK